MAWTAIAPGVGIQHTAFLNEFVGAENERRRAFGNADLRDDFQAGDAIQDNDTWVHPQSFIRDSCSEFVYSHGRTDYDGYHVQFWWWVPGSPGHWEGATPSIPNYAWADGGAYDLVDAAGIPTPNYWRRLQCGTHHWPDYDDGGYIATGYGQCEEGDNLQAPALYIDIQNAFNEMVWTQEEFTVCDYERKYDADTDNNTWDLAKAGIEAAWPGKVRTANWGPAYTSGWMSFGKYSAEAYRFYIDSCSLAGVSNHCKSEVDFMFFPHCPIPYGEDAVVTDWFDGNGDCDGYQDCFMIHDTVRNDDGGDDPETVTLSSDLDFGPSDLALPEWCDNPSLWLGTQHRLGYELVAFSQETSIALVRWDVIDGFEYVAA